MNDAIANVQRMKAEITRLSEFITGMESEVNKRKMDFAKKEADFNATVDTISNQLKNDKIKIEKIIK